MTSSALKKSAMAHGPTTCEPFEGFVLVGLLRTPTPKPWAKARGVRGPRRGTFHDRGPLRGHLGEVGRVVASRSAHPRSPIFAPLSSPILGSFRIQNHGTVAIDRIRTS